MPDRTDAPFFAAGLTTHTNDSYFTNAGENGEGRMRATEELRDRLAAVDAAKTEAEVGAVAWTP